MGLHSEAKPWIKANFPTACGWEVRGTPTLGVLDGMWNLFRFPGRDEPGATGRDLINFYWSQIETFALACQRPCAFALCFDDGRHVPCAKDATRAKRRKGVMDPMVTTTIDDYGIPAPWGTSMATDTVRRSILAYLCDELPGEHAHRALSLPYDCTLILHGVRRTMVVRPVESWVPRPLGDPSGERYEIVLNDAPRCGEADLSTIYWACKHPDEEALVRTIDTDSICILILAHALGRRRARTQLWLPQGASAYLNAAPSVPDVFDPNAAFDPAMHVIASEYAAEEHRDVIDVAEIARECGTLEKVFDLCLNIALQKTDFNEKALHMFSAKNTLAEWAKTTDQKGALVIRDTGGRVTVNHRQIVKRLEVIATGGGKRAKVQPDVNAIIARAWWTVAYWASAANGTLLKGFDPKAKGSCGSSAHGWGEDGKPDGRVARERPAIPL
jgi:hypothetical protein